MDKIVRFVRSKRYLSGHNDGISRKIPKRTSLVALPNLYSTFCSNPADIGCEGHNSAVLH